VRVRPPSFVNLQSLDKMARGSLVADLVAVIGTIDIVLGRWTARRSRESMRKLLRRIFLVDFLEGLWVTFRHQHPNKIVTEQYPAERPRIAERYRGAPRLNINPENGQTLCIACDLCALACRRT